LNQFFQQMESKGPTYQAVKLAQRQDLEHDEDDSPLVVGYQVSKFARFKTIVTIFLILAGVAAFAYKVANTSTNGTNAYSALLVPGVDNSASEKTHAEKMSTKQTSASASEEAEIAAMIREEAVGGAPSTRIKVLNNLEIHQSCGDWIDLGQQSEQGCGWFWLQECRWCVEREHFDMECQSGGLHNPAFNGNTFVSDYGRVYKSDFDNCFKNVGNLFLYSLRSTSGVCYEVACPQTNAGKMSMKQTSASASEEAAIAAANDGTDCSQGAIRTFEQCLLGTTLTDPNQLCSVLESKLACFPECNLPEFYVSMVGSIPALHEEDCVGGDSSHKQYFNQGMGLCVKGDGTPVSSKTVSGSTYLDCQVQCNRDSTCMAFSYKIVNDFSYSDCFHYTEAVPMMGGGYPRTAFCFSTVSTAATPTASLLAEIEAAKEAWLTTQNEAAIGSPQINWFEVEGNGCDVDNNCVSSKNYPQPHGNHESCTVTVLQDANLVTDSYFDVEEGWDFLNVEGINVESADQVPFTVYEGNTITWETDSSVSKVGWKICFHSANCYPTGDRCAHVETAESVAAGLDIAGTSIGAVGTGVGLANGIAGGVISLVGGVVDLTSSITGAIAGAMVDCAQCCEEYSWWWGNFADTCGPEPCWEDGSLCGIGTTCNSCCNDHTYWYSKAMTACGPEPCWEDGSVCGVGTTCNACCNGNEWWASKFFTACGREPCMADGTLCGIGTTCNDCCSDLPWSYWYGKAMTACGQEPCWGSGTFCLLGTSCNRCCNGYNWWSTCK